MRATRILGRLRITMTRTQYAAWNQPLVSEVNASINRSISSGLAVKDRETGQAKPNRRNLYNFVVHGLKFVFPAKPGAMTRGIPTAFAAAPLKNLLISAGEYIYVWPYAKGKDMGQAVDPLFKSVPQAIQKDDRTSIWPLSMVSGLEIKGRLGSRPSVYRKGFSENDHR